MKALVYEGARKVSVKDVPDAKIERPTDVLVKITSTNICGSDLHMYEGRTDMQPGRVLGHENLGQVVEVGDAVARIKVGDWVCLPFNIGCGFCKNCEAGLTAFCLTVNPGMAGAAYGFAGMGPFNGEQAEYLRVPDGDFNCLRLPPDAQEKEMDYVMCADIHLAPTRQRISSANVQLAHPQHLASTRIVNRSNPLGAATTPRPSLLRAHYRWRSGSRPLRWCHGRSANNHHHPQPRTEYDAPRIGRGGQCPHHAASDGRMAPRLGDSVLGLAKQHRRAHGRGRTPRRTARADPMSVSL